MIRILIISFCLCVLGCGEAKVKTVPQQTTKQNPKLQPQVTPKTDEVSILKPPPYRYEKFNRIDPFEPILKEEEGKPTTSLNPLEKYDISELKLKAILYDPKNPLALVEDPEGNTYLLKRGDKIGKNNGKITRISRDNVYIIEKYEDIFGNTRTNEVVLTTEIE